MLLPVQESYIKGTWEQNQTTKDYIENKISESLGEYYDYLKLIEGLKDADHIQARMPFELNIR